MLVVYYGLLDFRKTLANKEAVMGVFLDIERTCDMLWKEGLMLKLHDAGIRGQMLYWIRNFLKDCTIQVRVGEVVSGKESPISPVLFNVMITNIFSEVGNGFGILLFADDGGI